MQHDTRINLTRLDATLQTAGRALGESTRTGDLVMKVGRVCKPVWNLRASTLPGAAPFAQLTLNDVVLVERSMKGRPQDPQSWLYVFSQRGRAGELIEGWVNSAGVLLNPPEPTATVAYLPSGGTLLDVVEREYGKGGFSWGDDKRFYVAALAYVNRGYNGLRFPPGWTDADFQKTGRWAKIGINADHAIWIPSRTVLQPLKGKFVSTGSVSYEMWKLGSRVAADAWETAVGAVAFAAGLIHGAAVAVYEALTDLIELAVLAWKLLKSLLTGQLLKDAKELWNTLRSTDWSAVVGGLIDDFLSKWNADATWDQWYFRGYVVGYVVGTAALTALSAGLLATTGALSKSGKLGRALSKVVDNPAVKAILDAPAVRRIRSKADDVLSKSKEVQEKLAEWNRAARRGKFQFQVLAEGPPIPGTSIPEWLRIKVGQREWRVERNAQKLAKDGHAIGPATKHMAEKAQSASGFAKASQVDFPISSLAAALEEAEGRLLAKTAQSGTLFTVEGWELGVNTNETVWRVYHAVYNPAIK